LRGGGSGKLGRKILARASGVRWPRGVPQQALQFSRDGTAEDRVFDTATAGPAPLPGRAHFPPRGALAAGCSTAGVTVLSERDGRRSGFRHGCRRSGALARASAVFPRGVRWPRGVPQQALQFSRDGAAEDRVSDTAALACPRRRGTRNLSRKNRRRAVAFLLKSGNGYSRALVVSLTNLSRQRFPSARAMAIASCLLRAVRL